jgi:hypothetical protein
VSLAIASVVGPAVADETAPLDVTDPLKEAFSSATTNVNFRYRLGSVDRGGKDDALASTLRRRLTFCSTISVLWVE